MELVYIAMMGGFVTFNLTFFLRRSFREAFLLNAFGFLLMTFFINYNNLVLGPYESALAPLITLLRNAVWFALLLLCIRSLRTLGQTLTSGPFVSALGLLLAGIVSMIVNLERGANAEEMALAIRTVVICVSVLLIMRTNFRSQQQIMDVFLILAILQGMLALSGPLDYVFGNPDQGRASGLRGQSNGLAYYTAIGVPVLESMRVLSGTRFRKAVWMVLVALAGLGVLATGSRGGFITYIVAVLWTYRRLPRGRMIGLAIAVGLLVGGFFMNQSIQGSAVGEDSQTTFERMEQMRRYLNNQEDDSSVRVRIEFVFDGLQYLSQDPWFGIGPWMFAEYRGLSAHNIYIQALSETGLFGLAALLGLAVSGFLLFRKNRMRARILPAAMPIYYFNNAAGIAFSLVWLYGCFSNSLYSYIPFVYLGMGMSVQAYYNSAAAPPAVRPVPPAKVLYKYEAGVV